MITGIWCVTREDYFADRTCVNHSSLEVFRRSSREYQGRFVSVTIPEPAPTAQMRLGTFLHVAVLEPAIWRAERAVAPDVDLRTKVGKAAWEDFQANARGKYILSAEEDGLVSGMAAGVRANGLVADWLDRPGETEHAIRWQDPATGLWCKALLDFLSGSVILDLKSASDPHAEAFARSVQRFGYHRQAAWYQNGVGEALNIDDSLFVHVVIGSAPPHECFAYVLEPDAISLGRQQNARSLERLAFCRDSGSWDSPGHNDLNTIRLPKWAWEEA